MFFYSAGSGFVGRWISLAWDTQHLVFWWKNQTQTGSLIILDFPESPSPSRPKKKRNYVPGKKTIVFFFPAEFPGNSWLPLSKSDIQTSFGFFCQSLVWGVGFDHSVSLSSLFLTSSLSEEPEFICELVWKSNRNL